jgi:hypothetical protein
MKAISKSSLIALLFVLLPGLRAHAECDDKKNCHCECTTITADAKGVGLCSIAENEKKWCSISYTGNTGSIGPDSVGPDFSTADPTYGLPDHRSDLYAAMLERARQTILGPRVTALLAGNIPPDALALIIRSSYVSSRGITIEQINTLDKILDTVLGFQNPSSESKEVMSALAGQGTFDRDGVTAKRAYLRIESGTLSVRFIVRDLLVPR